MSERPLTMRCSSCFKRRAPRAWSADGRAFCSHTCALAYHHKPRLVFKWSWLPPLFISLAIWGLAIFALGRVL
jgi:hypothetical protein